VNVIGHIITFWRRLSLPQQFALISAACVVPALVGLGFLLQSYFTRAAIDNAAAVVALQLDRDVSAHVDDFATDKPLLPATLAALDRISKAARGNPRVLSLKVWRANGDVIYATRPELIGKNFPNEDDLGIAFTGKIEGQLDEPETENLLEQSFGVPLFEIYAPVRRASDNKIVAVSEAYFDGTELAKQVNDLTRKTWLSVALASLGIISVLSLLVHQAARTINRQTTALDQKVGELSSQLLQNRKLSNDLRASHQRFAHITEETLRRAGSDLHDGPVQLLALLALRLPVLKNVLKPDKGAIVAHKEMSDLASTAMRDLRKAASGLVLPQFEGMGLQEVLEMAIHDHEARSHTRVERAFDDCSIDCPEVVKVTAYRVVQESLTNAVKHAGTKGHRVEFTCTPDIDIRILDRGPGISGSFSHDSLGLRGMQARMEAIGGTLTFELRDGGGTMVCAHLAAKRLPELTGMRW
jgi:signal transduction histidine kinase